MNEMLNPLSFSNLFPLIILFLNIPIISPFITSFYLVARFIYLPSLVDAKIEDKEWREYLYYEEINQEYSKKFPLLKDLSDNPHPEYTFFCDTTPNGFAFLRYTKEEEGFEYWCDKTIDYKNLETLCRKYVNYFNCKQIYHDRQKMLQDKLEKINEIKNNSKTIDNGKPKNDDDEGTETDNSGVDISKNKIDKNESVFANLKSSKPVLKKIEYVCDNANKYIKRGSLKDYKNMVKHPLTQNIKNENDDKFFSWSSWKSSNKE